MQVLVAGLGRFGSNLACALAEAGHDVVALDLSERAVQGVAQVVDQAVVGDAANEAVLREVGATDVDLAVVGMAGVESSVLITSNLKTLNVPRVFAKASSEAHRLILERVGADRVVFPERDMAERLAQSVSRPGQLDYLELLPHIGISEVRGEGFAGQSLANLNLRARFGVNVLVVKRGNEVVVMPDLTERIAPGDVLVVVGRDRQIAELQAAAG